MCGDVVGLLIRRDPGGGDFEPVRGLYARQQGGHLRGDLMGTYDVGRQPRVEIVGVDLPQLGEQVNERRAVHALAPDLEEGLSLDRPDHRVIVPVVSPRLRALAEEGDRRGLA